MAEVDTSIYPKAVAPTNPLTMLGQFAGAQNALNTNRLFQQEFADRAALNNAYSGAFDPTTGQVDTNMLTRTLAGSGAGRLLPEALAKAQDYKASAAKASQAEIESYKAHTAIAGDALVPLLLDDKSTQDDAVKAIRQVLVQHPQGQNGFTPKWAGDILGSMPNNPQDPDNQAKYRVWLKQMAVRNAGAAAQLSAAAGENILVNNGQSLIPMHRESAIAGGATSGPTGAPIQTYPSRGELAARVPGAPVPAIDPRTGLPNADAGAQTTVPLGAVTPPDLGGPAVTGGLPVRPAAPAAAAPAPPLPKARPKPAAAASAPVAATGGALPGQVTTGQGPQQAASNAADVAQYKSDQATVAQHARNVQSLEKALEALKHSDQGRSTEATHAMYSFLNAQGAITPGLADDVKNYDLFKKYTTEFASRAAGAGGNTDLARTLSEAANAGPGISHAANMEVLKTNIGREKQEIAQVQEHGDNTGVGYGAHKSKFTTATDPRAFAWEHYSPAERDKIEKSLKPGSTEEANFYRSLAIAKRRGLINGQ